MDRLKNAQSAEAHLHRLALSQFWGGRPKIVNEFKVDNHLVWKFIVPARPLPLLLTDTGKIRDYDEQDSLTF